MSLDEMHQLPLRLARKAKGRAHTQFAALCWRIVNGGPEICLITTRGKGRWTLPKGWPMDGQTPAEAAAMEAFEEAGLTGQSLDRCLGVYTYVKPKDKSRTPHLTLVFPLQVQTIHADWPERAVRRRKWVSPAKAARLLKSPELRHIVEQFDPRQLHR
ncbi:NUDIX hydrolase [Flavimaricola marinus]|uniref:Diadenosine hexaphosphate hydrolase n=1 Tax=Flavimaricola marinus TaxID=1819565 RepID=A0A238LAV1_9RHOB|nr:NUDIX hydrolase [Flavimaricola marinus]SMY06555.1 Diadenosine hexaphosphate hydrolase [Flavimaricola marinus]